MGRSPTIHVTPEDRSRFGSFLSWALTLTGKDVKWLEDEWHKGAETKHERRRTDIADYLEGRRIPDLFNLDRLGVLLNIPPGPLYLAAGYFELMLGCLSAAAEHLESGAWNHNESPRMAALARLLSLFPGDDMDAALDQSVSLYYIFEKMGRLNIGGGADWLHRLWPFWTWVMPQVIRRSNMVHREHRNVRKALLESAQMGHDLEPESSVYRAIRAEHEFSFADDVTTDLISEFRQGPAHSLDDLLTSAVENLRDNKNNGRSWRERTRIASHFVLEWVAKKYGDPQNLRNRLRGCQERIITEEDEAQILGFLSIGESESKATVTPPRFE